MKSQTKMGGIVAGKGGTIPAELRGLLEIR